MRTIVVLIFILFAGLLLAKHERKKKEKPKRTSIFPDQIPTVKYTEDELKIARSFGWNFPTRYHSSSVSSFSSPPQKTTKLNQVEEKEREEREGKGYGEAIKIYVYPYKPTYLEKVSEMENKNVFEQAKFLSHSILSLEKSGVKGERERERERKKIIDSVRYPLFRNFSKPFDHSLLSESFGFRGQAWGLGIEHRIANSILFNNRLITNDPEEADLFFLDYAPYRGAHSSDDRLLVLDMILSSPYFIDGYNNHFFIHNMPWYDLWGAYPEATAEEQKIMAGWHNKIIDIGAEEFHPDQFSHITVPYSDDGWGTDFRTWSWRDISDKKYLGCFYGSISRIRAKNFRRKIQSQFRAAQEEGHKFVWSEFDPFTKFYNYSEQMELLRKCRFCPVPPGDSASSKRFFDAIQADCIPIVMSDKFILPYHRIIDYNSFIYRIPQTSFKYSTVNIADFILNISKEEEEEKREIMRGMKHHFIFNDPFIFPGDAMDLLLRELQIRVDLLKSGRSDYLENVQQKKKRLGVHSVVGGRELKEKQEREEEREKLRGEKGKLREEREKLREEKEKREREREKKEREKKGG